MTNPAKTEADAKQAASDREGVRPRTPGEPGQAQLDPQPNAGRLAQPRTDTVQEAADKARAAELAVTGARQGKLATEPLRGTVDEQLAALNARMAEADQRMTELMAANRALVLQNRKLAPPAVTQIVLPTKESVMELAFNGDLDGPMLTQEGWIAPRVTTSNPEQALTAAALLALNHGGTMAEQRKRRETALMKGRQDAVDEAEKEADEQAAALRQQAKSVEKTASHIASSKG